MISAFLTVKQQVSPPTDPGRFETLVDNVVISGAASNAGVGPIAVKAGTTHTVTARAVAPTDRIKDKYVITITGDCPPDGRITLGPGARAVCTVTAQTADLTVVKRLVHPWSKSTRLFNLLIDGAVVARDINGGSSGPQTVGQGRHVVSETGGTGSSLGAFSTTIGGDCANDGSIVLSSGDSKSCTITNYDRFGGCNVSWTCCEPGNGTNGCKKCVAPGKQCP